MTWRSTSASRSTIRPTTRFISHSRSQWARPQLCRRMLPFFDPSEPTRMGLSQAWGCRSKAGRGRAAFRPDDLWGSIDDRSLSSGYDLRDVMAALSQAAAGARLPLLPALFHPDRWLLWLGLAFVLAVYFAPLGIVGALKADEAKAE